PFDIYLVDCKAFLSQKQEMRYFEHIETYLAVRKLGCEEYRLKTIKASLHHERMLLLSTLIYFCVAQHQMGLIILRQFLSFRPGKNQ
ncbi:MAG TPA: hypothetical protein VN626_06495, partial [Clostridia bacterium]|nr:hypothetical protein [Clostridia bacterium]